MGYRSRENSFAIAHLGPTSLEGWEWSKTASVNLFIFARAASPACIGFFCLYVFPNLLFFLWGFCCI